jgi:SnoaL-like domain
VPWAPELFSAPILERLQEKWERELVTVPFFDGLMTGEFDALLGSFAGVPELHHPVRGRIKGERAFVAFVVQTRAWLAQPDTSVEDLGHVIRSGRRGCGEAVLHVEGKAARVGLPVAVVADRAPDGRIDELRMYYTSWPLTGRRLNRPPLLQPDPDVQAPDAVGDHQRALEAGDAEAILATFEPDGYVRQPAGGDATSSGPEGLRAFYQRLAGNAGVGSEHCTVTDDGQACALEYNVVRLGRAPVPPQAGVAVYVRGQNGTLAAIRVYDDVSPPQGA